MHRAACGHGDRPMGLWWAVSPPQGLNVAPESCQQDVHDLVTLHRNTESQWKLTKQQKQHKFKVVQLEKLQPPPRCGVELLQDQKTHLGLSLPLSVGQDLPEGRPDVEAVQLEPGDQLLAVKHKHPIRHCNKRLHPLVASLCRLRAGPGRSGRPSTGSHRRLAQGRTPSDLKRREPRPAGRRHSSPWPGRMSGVTGSLTKTPKQTHRFRDLLI